MTPADVPGGISLDQLAPWMRSFELRPAPAPSPLRPPRLAGSTMSKRTRVVNWTDPTVVSALLGARDGVAGLKAIAAGEIPPPPVAELMGFDIEVVEPGRVVFGLDPEEFLYNPIGMVHGGVVATLLDSAMGSAVASTLPAGVSYTTLDLAIKYVRPLLVETGHVRAEGIVVHRGGRVSTAEGRLVAADDGRLLAHATTTCLLLGDAVARPRAA